MNSLYQLVRFFCDKFLRYRWVDTFKRWSILIPLPASLRWVPVILHWNLWIYQLWLFSLYSRVAMVEMLVREDTGEEALFSLAFAHSARRIAETSGNQGGPRKDTVTTNFWWFLGFFFSKGRGKGGGRC